MSRARKRTHGDPRRLGGTIAGPGGPRDRNSVVIDFTDGVLLDGLSVAQVEPHRDGEAGQPVFAMALRGRINKTAERTEVLYFLDEDGLAAVVTEIVAVASRSGGGAAERLLSALDERMTRLRAEDAIRPVEEGGDR